MLKIKHAHHFSLPHVSLGLPRQMQLAPVRDDGDELSQAISRDTIDHDNNWELVERPEPGQLEAYWSVVEEDVQNDPEWFKFADE